jgi:hypothetical protein
MPMVPATDAITNAANTTTGSACQPTVQIGFGGRVEIVA